MYSKDNLRPIHDNPLWSTKPEDDYNSPLYNTEEYATELYKDNKTYETPLYKQEHYETSLYIKGQRNSSAAWDPSQLSLYAWWDASNINDFSTTGIAINQWNDKSGNGNHLTAAGASRPRYISADNYVYFDGGDSMTVASDFGISNSDTDFVVLMVMEFNDVAPVYGGLWILGNSSCDGVDLLGGAGDSTSGWSWRHNGGNRIFSAPSASTNYLAMWERSQGDTYAEGRFYLDGTADSQTSVANGTTVPSFNPTNFCVGVFDNNVYANFNLHEMLVLPSVTTDERQKLEGYLAHKWNLTSSLPSDHPYKSSAPTL
jgi:hypothetical protein